MQVRCPDAQKWPGRCRQFWVYMVIRTSVDKLLLIFWTLLVITWSELSWLFERILNTLKSPNCFEWLSLKMKDECSQEISKAWSLESIILRFTLHQNCPQKSKMESSQTSHGSTSHVTVVKLRVWGSFDPKSVCKIYSLTSFTQLDVFEGIPLLDCNLQGTTSFSRIRAAD